MLEKKISFIGGGYMASSIIHGLVANGHDPKKIWVSNPPDPHLEELRRTYEVNTTHANIEAATHADICILAVKPQVLPEVCQELKSTLAQRHPLVVSIAAGITTTLLHSWLGEQTQVVRAMPNLPAAILQGITALYANPHIDAHSRQLAEEIFQSVGTAVWLTEENLMDPVTALSGSGPAYFFLFLESLTKAGEALGLDAETARQLALQTGVGALLMAKQSNTSFAELRKKVTSKGGTTERALTVFQEKGLVELVAEAVNAASQRARELRGDRG